MLGYAIASQPIAGQSTPSTGDAAAPGATLTATSSIAAGAASGTSAGTAPGATLTSASTIAGGTATGAISATAPGASLTGVATISAGVATGASGAQSATAPGASLTGIATISAGAASGAIPLKPAASQIYVGKPRVRTYVAQSMTNFTPKRVIERETFTVNFAPILPAGVTIESAAWQNSVVTGVDPNPAAMIDGQESISGTLVSQRIIGGVAEATYAPICIAMTSDGQELVLPEYGVGYLYVPG